MQVINWRTGEKRADPGKFPTVIEGKIEDGRLKIVVHDVFNKRVVETFAYAPRT